ncbi:MAG: thiamine-phosphate kinase [Patulibacter sp.]
MARSEFALIDAFRARLPQSGARVEVGSGDDCAVVRAGGSRAVVSVDTTVDGTHARLDLGDRLAAATDFGWRSLTTALSDLAACGAPPGEAYVALTAPRDTPDAILLALADGLGDAARRYGVAVIGGDVTSGPVVVVSTTVVGWLTGDEPPLTRAGAKPGDLVGLTGPIGGAGGGLALELRHATADDPPLDVELAAALRRAHRRPAPRLDAGVALREAGASAAIDLSDGLLADATHLARASGVTLHLDAAAVPLAPGVAAIAAELGVPPLAFAESAGEEFELLVTVPPHHRRSAELAGVIAWIGAVGPPASDAPPICGLPAPHLPRGGHDHRGTLGR